MVSARGSVMSIIRRRRGEQEYLYFQYYDNGKKIEEYIGPADNAETWEAWDRTRSLYLSKFSDWLKNRITELDKNVADAMVIPQSFGLGRSFKIAPKSKEKKGRRPGK
jgi:hypothetical protein